jgi:hypothetical protein
MEDVNFMEKIKKKGGKIKILPQKVSTSSRRWREEGILYCTMRNWALITLYKLGINPYRLAEYYKASRIKK